jgi:hypothetical protein
VSVKSFRENVPQKDSSPSQQAIYTSLGIGPALLLPPVGGAPLELICSSVGELRRSKGIHLSGCLLPCSPV